MNKILLLLLLLITYCTFGQQNLIKNGDFERSFEYWKTKKENGAIASFILDPRNKKTGKFSLKTNIARSGLNDWDICAIQKFFSKKGKNYRISLAAKTRLKGKQIRLRVQNKTASSKILTLNNIWDDHSWEFTATEDDQELSIQFIQVGTFFIDNIVVKEIKTIRNKSPKPIKSTKNFKTIRKPSTPSPVYTTNSNSKKSTVIQNGDFEQGMMGWRNEQYNGAEAKFSLNTKSQYGEKNSLRVVTSKFGPNPWDIQSLKKIDVKKNKNYKLTFFAKANGKNKNLKVQAQDNANKIYLVKTFIVTNTWASYEWSFKAESNTMELALQHISKGTMDFDNIVLQQTN